MVTTMSNTKTDNMFNGPGFISKSKSEVKSKEKEVVYISGKMAGEKDHGYDIFNTVAKKWREAGWIVVNPAENFGGNSSMARNTYLKMDYSTLISSCNAIALLPNWDKSVGATTELAIAYSLKYTVYDATEPGKLYPGISGPELVVQGNLLKSVVHTEDNKSFEYCQHCGNVGINRIRNTTENVKAEKLPVWGASNNDVVKSPLPVPTVSICEVADKIVSHDRQAVYGSPSHDFTRQAKILSALGFNFLPPNSKSGEPTPLNAEHIPLIMLAVKLSRLANTQECFHRDTLIDIAGYAKCADMVQSDKHPVKAC